LGISLPIILYFVGSFVVPGLTTKEKRVFFPGCVAATLLFLAGASMTYFFILPMSLAFTIEFSFNVLGLDVYRPEAGNYYSTVIWMTFAVGIAFQFPLVLILLIRIGILSVIKLRESRRIVLVILMVSAALITPGGDPVSLCILTIPLYILYEFAILTGTVVERRKAIREWKEWDEELQGPQPGYPKAENSSSLFYLVILIVIGLISFAAWKYKDQLMDALQMLSGEDSQISPPAIDGNASQSPATKATKIMQRPTLDGSFIIELSPINESNASGSESSDGQDMKRFRAKIVSD
jgi:Tat protein translocase TatC